MAKRLKVMTVVGTRPEIIRLSRVIPALDQHCDHVLIHTGQNYDYELNEIFFKDLGLRTPDYFLEAAGETAAQTIGNTLIRIEPVLNNEKPDAFLVLGDTNSCLAAIIAKRKKVPIFHMEAGNRCFDQRVPEETNRRIVDHISDINLTYSSIAKDYLLREGIPPDRVIKTGSPMREVLQYFAPRIEASVVLERLSVTPNEYFVVSLHREENIDVDSNLNAFVDVLNIIASTFQKKIIFSTHPRTRKRLETLKAKLSSRVELLKPLSFTDYIRLQKDARAVLSDSGTITEESSILNFPALNLREAHERPEGMEEASVMLVGCNCERILQGLSLLATQPRGSHRLFNPVSDYGWENVSQKIVRIILSYTDYVNRTVWNK